jgi:hypothetical protein
LDDGKVHGWKGGWMDGWMDGWMGGEMYGEYGIYVYNAR